MSPAVPQPATPTVSPPQLPLLFGVTGLGTVELCWQDRQDGQLTLHCPRSCYRRLLPSVPIPVDCLLLGDLLLSYNHALIRARPPKVLRKSLPPKIKHTVSFSPHFFLPPVSFLLVPPRSNNQKRPRPLHRSPALWSLFLTLSHIEGGQESVLHGW